jgi:hypothetical protein
MERRVTLRNQVCGELSSLLQKLLNSQVAVREAETPPPDALVGVFLAGHDPIAACAVDFPTAAIVSGALLAMEGEQIRQTIRSGKLDDDLSESLREVFNVCSRLFNGEGKTRIVLGSVCRLADAPDKIRAALAKSSRVEVEVEVGEYGSGRMWIAEALAEGRYERGLTIRRERKMPRVRGTGWTRDGGWHENPGRR